MFAVLRQRSFALVWLAGLISFTGDWILLIGLPLYVYTLTHSTLETSFTFMVGAAPTILFGPIAGVFVDRWNRKTVLIVANTLLALELLPLLLVNSMATLWIVYAVQFVAACVSQFLTPATDAILPSLVEERHLLPANSLTSIGSNVTRLIGPPLGGVVAVGLGLSGVALLDAVSFALAALLVSFITLRPIAAPHSDGAAELLVTPIAPTALAESQQAPTLALAETTGASAQAEPSRSLAVVGHELLDGLRLIVKTPAIRIVFAALALTSIGEGIFAALLVPFVTRSLHGSGQDYGWFVGLQAVGGLIGSLVIGRFGERISSRWLIGFGTLGLGLVDLAIFMYPLFLPGVTLAFILIALAGLPAAGSSLGAMTWLQKTVASAYLGRIFAAVGVIFTLFSLLGEALAGLLGDPVGIIPIITIHAITLMLGGLIVLALWPSRKQKTTAILETRADNPIHA